VDPARAIADLRELHRLTGGPDGARRVAWTDEWERARAFLLERLEELPVVVERDAAGNIWALLEGDSEEIVAIGSHVDSVPAGGWLDGALGVFGALEVLRSLAAAGRPARTVALVDWADEEGARFGRSLVGSSAAGGSLKVDDLRSLVDKQGTAMPDALRENGIDIERMLDAHAELKRIRARAYLELHIEQGPVLETMNKPTGVVLGTFGVERHMLRFTGQAAHSGSTPIPMRRDAFLAAASASLEFREIARRHSKPGQGVVCTVGIVKTEPGIVTAVPGVCEISLDQRALDAEVLARMLADARAASETAAEANHVTVEWKPVWRIEPRPFDPTLIELCAAAVQEVTGDAPHLPSGPLHDAAEMVPHMPVVMMFAYSSNGLSHCKEEDTPEPYLLKTIEAFLRLVERALRA